MEPPQILISFAVGAVVSAAATPLVARLALALDVRDRPNERTVNERFGIPLMGGLAVSLGTLGALVTAALLSSAANVSLAHYSGLLVGGVMMLTMGVYDDRFGMKALPKLVVQSAAAAIAFYYGYRIDFIREPITGTGFDLPTWLALATTIFWICSVTNAMNLIDGLDGLASGVSGIIALALTMICFPSHTTGLVLGAALLGGIAGFLPYNFPPARIFLGDMGAYFLGFALALLAIEGYRKAAPITFGVPLLALAVPLLDTGVSILRRLLHGKKVMGADRMHMHHRLLSFQRDPRDAVLYLYFLTGSFCIIAVGLSFSRQVSGYTAIPLVLLVGVLTIRLLRNLGLLSHEEEDVAAEPTSGTTGGDDR